MIYTCNDDLKKELKKLLIDEELSLTDVADKLKISRQQLNNIFLKTNFSFNDMQKICDAIGYKLEINILKE
jgi:DNA-binding Xre family transcriptional regulator